MAKAAKKKPAGVPAWPGMLDQVHQGDCIALANAIPDECVDLVFTDPPFNEP